jgi:hypothetical protein
MLRIMDNSKNNGGNPLTVWGAPIHAMFHLETQSSNGTITTVHASNSMHSTIEGDNGSRILATDDGFSADADIGKFLSRKVKIATYQWAVGAHLAYNFAPWNLFLANAAVANKLQNYQLIKGDLKLTFYVNGTPFHLGMLMVSYNYLGAGSAVVTIGGDTQLVTRSQRPHLYLNVSTNKSGCLCLPFFLPTNYLSLTSPLFNSAGIGTLNLDSFAALAQINAGTDTVTITVFAEMLNVKLTGPTMVAVSLAGPTTIPFDMFVVEPQSDEYDNTGVISGPASAVADFAGKLTNVPVIAPFALATQIGATATGNIARLFGYSKPVQIADVQPMRNYPVSSLALVEGADTSQKLTMTGKAELSIDPNISELDSTDELSMEYIVTKESYITQFSWDVTDLVDTTLFAMDVDPMAERRAAVSGGYQIIPTALSFASRPFSAWSGTLKYRFQVIASQYHRGRISIIYDPTGPLTGDPYNTTFNSIIDLEDARDFTMEVKWQQDRAYCFISTDNTRTFYTQTAPQTRTSTRDTCNGIFYVRVVNELVVPDGTTGATILVSISAGDDFELVNPKGSSLAVETFAPVAQALTLGSSMFDLFNIVPQSSSTEITPEGENAPEQETQTLELTTSVRTSPMEKPLMFYGERFVSFRQLLKRYTFFRALSYSSGAASQIFSSMHLRQMPAMPGFDPNGPDLTAALTPYTYVGNCYINYLKLAYAGWKGSIRWKFLPVSSVKTMSVSRNTGDEERKLDVDYAYDAIYAYAVGATNAFVAGNRLFTREMTGGGAAITQCRTQDALEVEIPYTTNLRFSKTHGDYLKVNTNSLANGYPGGDTFRFFYDSAPGVALSLIDTYVAAGEDFTLHGWVGAPVMYSSGTPPA